MSEILARMVFDTTNKVFITVVKHDLTSQTSFNTVGADQTIRCLLIGLCTSVYYIFVEQGYDMTKLNEYMDNEGIPIPPPPAT
jgi:hypothetical protein